MVISKITEAKIRSACSLISDVEWSGVLFFKIEGRFSDKSLVVKVIDFFPMDIGTSTYTEFMVSPDVPAYMIEHPELMEKGVFRGLIHSHNRMKAFFSGTDTATLKEFGEEMPHFVSLIVNNEGEYEAAITRRVDPQSKITRRFSYMTFGGKVVVEEDSAEDDTTIIEYFNLDIQVDEYDGLSELKDRFKQIHDEKRKAANLNNLRLPSYDNNTIMVPKSVRDIYLQDDSSYKKFGRDSYMESSVSKGKSEVGTVSPMKEEEEEEEEGLIYYDSIKVDSELIDSLVRQLLTASVVIPNGSKLDLNKWANSMDTLFSKRFESKELFEQFAANYVDFLLFSTKDDKILEQVEEDESSYAAVIAYKLIAALKELPTNKWIKQYVSLLEDYII